MARGVGSGNLWHVKRLHNVLPARCYRAHTSVCCEGSAVKTLSVACIVVSPLNKYLMKNNGAFTIFAFICCRNAFREHLILICSKIMIVKCGTRTSWCFYFKHSTKITIQFLVLSVGRSHRWQVLSKWTRWFMWGKL